jgi:hypothetical protein
LKPNERGRVRNDSRAVEVNKKIGGNETRLISGGGRRKRILLEGTQAIPARPSDKDKMGVKTLGWRVVELDTNGGILFACY